MLLLPPFLSWELSWRDSWVRNPTILTVNSHTEENQARDTTPASSSVSRVDLLRTVVKEAPTLCSPQFSQGTLRLSHFPSPSHPSPTFSALPNRHEASNPTLAMRLWAVILRSDPCRCWGKLRLREAPELKGSPRMGHQRTWPGQGSRPLVGEPRAWQSQGMEAPPPAKGPLTAQLPGTQAHISHVTGRT